MKKQELISDDKMFEILSDASTFYEAYISLQKTKLDFDYYFEEENYYRDMSHPLGLVVTG